MRGVWGAAAPQGETQIISSVSEQSDTKLRERPVGSKLVVLVLTGMFVKRSTFVGARWLQAADQEQVLFTEAPTFSFKSECLGSLRGKFVLYEAIVMMMPRTPANGK